MSSTRRITTQPIDNLKDSFLNDVQRIASYHYTPTDHDIVRARLRTMGVQEYRIRLDNAATSCKDETLVTPQDKDTSLGREWIFYDVGGCRSSVSSTHFCITSPGAKLHSGMYGLLSLST